MKTNPPLLDALKQSDVFHGLDQPQYESVVRSGHQGWRLSGRERIVVLDPHALVAFAEG